MTINNRTTHPKRAVRREGVLPLTASVLVLALAACDTGQILETTDPDVILPGSIEGAATLPAVHAHAMGEFISGYVGQSEDAPNDGESAILMSGLLTDEFIHTGTFDTREAIDRRIVPDRNASLTEMFRLMHRGRVAAEWASEGFAEFGANTPEHAEVQSLAGYSYVMFGENFCAGVPFSRQLENGQFEFGSGLTTTATFDRAVEYFDGALAAATAAGDAEQQNLARVGRARALLGMGLYDEAAAAAAEVPTGFVYEVFHSQGSSRQNNGVWRFNNEAGRWSVADVEGGNGLPFRSRGNIDGPIADPRIPTDSIGFAQRTGLRALGEHWTQLKYPERDSPTQVATGAEARLIQAEAALRKGAAGVAEFVALHNQLRESVGLAPFEVAAVAALSQDERVDLHFEERAYWLFITAHRLGDLRRLMWDYGRQQSELFPVGSHHRGGDYADATNFPIPFDEQNNPQSQGCITRDDAAGRT